MGNVRFVVVLVLVAVALLGQAPSVSAETSVRPSRFTVEPDRASLKCADVAGGATQDGANVQLSDCLSNQWNQQWRLYATSTSRFQIRAAHSLKCLDVDTFGGGTQNGVRVQQWTCLGSSQTNQIWEILTVPSGTGSLTSMVQIRSLFSGKCLTIAAGGSNGSALFQQTCGSSGGRDQWRLRLAPDQFVRAVVRHTGKCLTDSGVPADGRTVQQWSCPSSSISSQQQWRTRFPSSSLRGWMNLNQQAIGPGLTLIDYCLDVAGGTGATQDGVSIQMFRCLGASQTNQLWGLWPVGGDRFQVRAGHSSKCLDVDTFGGGQQDGARVQQWTCLGTGQTNQIWRFDEVEEIIR